jgi:hypothetical protein
MQMTAPTAADRHPLSMPLPTPTASRNSPFLLVSPVFTAIRTCGCAIASLHARRSTTNRSDSNAIGNDLRAPVLTGDMDGESSGIPRFQFLKALDNPC